MLRLGLISEAGCVQSPIEPIAAAIAGKHSAGAITAMRRRRQPNDKYAGLWIAKSGQRLGPVVFSLVSLRRTF